jgi:hypothetical protein
MAFTLHGKDGLVLEAAGEISADRNGLWTGSCRYSLPAGRLDLVPAALTPHPYAGFLVAERFRLTFAAGLWRLGVDYVGSNVEESVAQYELSDGTGNEPIQTHPDFLSELAGTASVPKNGALWRDPVTGEISSDDETAEFDRFRVKLEGGGQNPLAGLEEYIAQSNVVWSKSWTSRSAPAAQRIAIANPPGGAPDYGGSYNWLRLPVSFTVRGNVHSNVQRWLCSGPRGWHALVYPN